MKTHLHRKKHATKSKESRAQSILHKCFKSGGAWIRRCCENANAQKPPCSLRGMGPPCAALRKQLPSRCLSLMPTGARAGDAPTHAARGVARCRRIAHAFPTPKSEPPPTKPFSDSRWGSRAAGRREPRNYPERNWVIRRRNASRTAGRTIAKESSTCLLMFCSWLLAGNRGRIYMGVATSHTATACTPCGTRTRNLRIRCPTPCPLGQGGL